MGTTGTGRLTDYPGGGKSQLRSSQAGGEEGCGEPDRCSKAFQARLEDVERGEYYKRRGIPPVPLKLTVAFVSPRLAAMSPEGLLVGFLPTELNYLRVCLEQDFEYVGTVTKSISLAVNTVRVEAAFQPSTPA